MCERRRIVAVPMVTRLETATCWIILRVCQKPPKKLSRKLHGYSLSSSRKRFRLGRGGSSRIPISRQRFMSADIKLRMRNKDKIFHSRSQSPRFFWSRGQRNEGLWPQPHSRPQSHSVSRTITSGSGCSQKFEFFHWLMKLNAH